MNGTQLVAEYNRLASSVGAKPVKRFATRAAAVKRIAAIKAEASPATKAKVKKEKKTKEEKRSKIGVEFNVQSGSNREKMLEALHANYKKPVTVRDLQKSVYGSVSGDNKGAVNMVMRGMFVMITKGKLPYKIVKEKNEQKEITFALHPK